MPFASLAGDLGFSELTIAALLGYSARGVTQRYIHIGHCHVNRVWRPDRRPTRLTA